MFSWLKNKTERLPVKIQEQLNNFLERRLGTISIKEAERLIWELTYSYITALYNMEISTSNLESSEIIRGELASQFKAHFPNWNYATSENERYKELEEYKALRKSLRGDKYALFEIVKRVEKSIDNDNITRVKTIALLRNKIWERVLLGFKLLGFFEREVEFLRPHRFAIADFIEKIYEKYSKKSDAYRIVIAKPANQETSNHNGGDNNSLEDTKTNISFPIVKPEEAKKTDDTRREYARSREFKTFIVQNSDFIKKILELTQENPGVRWLLENPKEAKNLLDDAEKIGFEKFSKEIFKDSSIILELCILLKKIKSS